MWLLVVIIAYFLNAIAAVVDKFLISKKIPNPAVYTFYIALLGLVGLVLAPWGFALISATDLLWVLAAGLSFTFALLFLFKGLSVNETTRITPFIGGLSPVFVFLFSFWLLAERLASRQIMALVVIIVGTILISYGKSSRQNARRGFFYAFVSALLFGLSYTLTKQVYNELNFINGFVWLRLTTFLGGLLLLLSSVNRRDILCRPKKSGQTNLLFLGGQISGALSFILINYAISLASVTLVNALQGLQYVFLLFLILILAKQRPHLLEEKMKGRVLWQKITAVGLIVAGLVFLVL